jgi:CRISPR-associated protein Cas2
MSKEHAEKFKRAVRAELPERGHIVMAMLTDKQFGLMEVFHGIRQTDTPPGYTQLEFF